MSNLSDLSIATKRAHLFGCTSQQLYDNWTEVASCRGETAQGSIRSLLQRDVIAYTIIRWFSLMSNDDEQTFVFGGFIRAHYSGKSWNDIDIASTVEMVALCRKNLIFFVAFVLSIDRLKLRLSDVERKPYSSQRFTLTYHSGDEEPIKIKLDFSPNTWKWSNSFIP